jgi:peroxiredoxin
LASEARQVLRGTGEISRAQAPRALKRPDDLAGHFGVVLFYRWSWCPYCNAQLSAFQQALDRLAEMDVTVLALSMDDEATTQELIARRGLRFPGGTAPTLGDSRCDRRVRQR